MTEEELIKIGSLVKHTLSSRHPDNASGQDPCLSRKTGQTIGAGQSLFSLTALSGFWFLSVQRFLKCVEIVGECWGGKSSSFLDHLTPNSISFRFVY